MPAPSQGVLPELTGSYHATHITRRNMRTIFLSFAATLFSIACAAQTTARPEILVLGTYHMVNPGHDLYNMQADDVQSPKRQQEIAELIETLKKFHPTKVAIEADLGSKKVDQP